jgi:hypothetical protein
LFSVARSALNYTAQRPLQDAKLVAWMQGIVKVYPAGVTGWHMGER